MIRVFFSEQRPGEHPVALAQALGFNPEVPRNYSQRTCHAEIDRRGREFWCAAGSLCDADVAVWSYQYHAQPEALEFAHAARAAGKPCLFFENSDRTDPLPADYGTLYRYSLYADRRLPHEKVCAGACEDLLAGESLHLRPKRDRPVVGFCGYVDRGVKVMIRRLMGQNEKVAGHLIRAKALDSMRRSGSVECNFIERRSFAGGLVSMMDDAARIAAVKQEYVRNMLQSDFALCARGAGNFSLRFYEALSLGRIPLLISTRSVLPFDDLIDWNRHCVVLDESQVAEAPDRLAEFHARLAEGQFEQMQRANRRLFEQWMSPLSFLRRVLGRAVGSFSRAGFDDDGSGE